MKSVQQRSKNRLLNFTENAISLYISFLNRIRLQLFMKIKKCSNTQSQQKKNFGIMENI